MKITAQLLRHHGACQQQVDIFTQLWPRGATVTLRRLKRARAVNLDVEWLVRCMLPVARDAYTAAVRAAQDAYTAAVRAARDAYTAAVRAAQDAYYAAVRPAQDAYYAAVRPARDAYDAAVRPAWDAYMAAVDAALVAAFAEGAE